jgi:valyl-tRNA synthetase
LLISAAWPDLPREWIDESASEQMASVVGAIAVGRAVRSELNVPLSARPPLIVTDAEPERAEALRANDAVIRQMLRVSELIFDSDAGGGAIPYVADGAAFALPVADYIDLAAEGARLMKELTARGQEIERTSKKLSNPEFLSRAPEEVIADNRERLAEAESVRARLEEALARLEAIR